MRDLVRAAFFLLGVGCLVARVILACTPKQQLTVENAAAVAQYDRLLVSRCKAEAHEAGSIDAFDRCEARVSAEFCRTSGELRKEWARCKEVLP